MCSSAQSDIWIVEYTAVLVLELADTLYNQELPLINTPTAAPRIDPSPWRIPTKYKQNK